MEKCLGYKLYKATFVLFHKSPIKRKIMHTPTGTRADYLN